VTYAEAIPQDELKAVIESAYENAAAINSKTRGAVRDAVEMALNGLDKGNLRVAEKIEGAWTVHQWLKKAILLSFRLEDPAKVEGGPQGGAWWDKVPSKFADWKAKDFKEAGFRAVAGCVVRRSAYIAPGVVLMPCFVNLGARVDAGSMVDTWATVGSCAQIGKNVHLSGGAGIGGVLEPLQANPVIIEDNCFIGARAEVAEGVIVGEGSVLSMGVYLGQSTKIVNRMTGEVLYGRVPPYSVVVSGTMPGKPLPNGEPGPSLYCTVIVKTVDERTRAKTSINELLRD
jgi:2,3,4,5-tetrahydropyridine-2-carboxylate N-succinyltransferase